MFLLLEVLVYISIFHRIIDTVSGPHSCSPWILLKITWRLALYHAWERPLKPWAYLFPVKSTDLITLQCPFIILFTCNISKNSHQVSIGVSSVCGLFYGTFCNLICKGLTDSFLCPKYGPLKYETKIWPTDNRWVYNSLLWQADFCRS